MRSDCFIWRARRAWRNLRTARSIWQRPATCLMGLTSHGNVMVGNKAFEYYNERNPEDFIQIPWDEVDYIAAEVLRGTKKITRFAIFTKDNGHFTFSTRDDKETLRAVRKYVDEDKLVRSPTLSM